MKEKTKSLTKAFVGSALLISYITMFVVFWVAHYFATQYAGELVAVNWSRRGMTLLTMFTIIIGMCFVPIERIVAWLREDIFDYNEGFRSIFKKEKRSARKWIEYFLGYGILIYFVWFAREMYYYSFYRYYMCQFFTFVFACYCIAGIVSSFDSVEGPVRLIFLDQFLIVGNGVCVYYATRLFTYASIMTVALLIFFYVLYLSSNRKYKVLGLLLGGLSNVWEMIGAITLANRWDKVYAFLDYKKYLYSLGYEHSLLQSHSLLIPLDEVHMVLIWNHPFSEIYTFAGWEAAILFAVAFVIMGLSILVSYKVLPKKRFQVLLGFYIFACVYGLYFLLADLGYVPTCYTWSLFMNERIQLLYLGVMLRLLIVKPVKQKVQKESFLDRTIAHMFSLEDEEEDDLLDEAEWLEERRYQDLKFQSKVNRSFDIRFKELEERIAKLEALNGAVAEEKEDVDKDESSEDSKDASSDEKKDEIKTLLHILERKEEELQESEAKKEES